MQKTFLFHKSQGWKHYTLHSHTIDESLIVYNIFVHNIILFDPESKTETYLELEI